ncbi:MAG: PHP domain-containing protein [Fibrobacteraceae bacterium]|nr:PHP domain-containing protein [Fibrobacteraceae bacterium]MEE1068724.1 PHP domain-containing protein [Fibrobacteraceae bacterium]
MQISEKSFGDLRGFADLHLHTKFSDGELSVEDLIRLAKKKGLRCISITDHDNLDSFQAAIEPAREANLEIIPGIEISSVWQGRDIHILGYFCDPTNLALNLELENFMRQRITRAKAIIKKLNALGIDIRYEKVASYCKGKVIGRPHIAMTLVDEEYISSFAEAFTKYLGEGCAAFVEKKGLNPQQTIRLIENSGGIAVLAHPYKSGIDEAFIEDLVDWGIQGIETYSPAQKGNVGRRFREIAQRFNLVGTGGSDFHSMHGLSLPNCMKMPYSVVAELKERREKSRAEWF